MMLLIPIPLLYKARLAPKRKAVLLGVFSLGIFVVLASILNRYYNFTEPYGSLVYLYWYAGESSTALMVANIPHCWPIVARLFRLSSFKMYGASGGATPQYGNTGVESGTGANRRSRFTGNRSNTGYSKNTGGQSSDNDADSIERIVGGKGEMSDHASKDDLIIPHAVSRDIQLGPISPGPKSPSFHSVHALSSPPPEYEARATAERSSVRIPNLRGNSHGKEHSISTPKSGIVKTIEVDQKYEDE